jgi:hypothetical protein
LHAGLVRTALGRPLLCGLRTSARCPLGRRGWRDLSRIGRWRGYGWPDPALALFNVEFFHHATRRHYSPSEHAPHYGNRNDGDRSKPTRAFMLRIVEEYIEVVAINHPKHNLSKIIKGEEVLQSAIDRVPKDAIDNTVLVQRSINRIQALHAQ